MSTDPFRQEEHLMQRRSFRPSLLLILLCAALAFAPGCASDGDDAGAASSKAAAGTAPPAGSPLSKVELGTDDETVRGILGPPDKTSAYMTGKSWIPFYYGPDTHRTDWMYKGQGRVVFSRNRWSGQLKVIVITYDPNETAGL